MDPSKVLLWIKTGGATLGGAIVDIVRNALKIERHAIFLAEYDDKQNFERF